MRLVRRLDSGGAEAARTNQNPRMIQDMTCSPDNITVGPDGRLYLCEDGDGEQSSSASTGAADFSRP